MVEHLVSTLLQLLQGPLLSTAAPPASADGTTPATQQAVLSATTLSAAQQVAPVNAAAAQQAAQTAAIATGTTTTGSSATTNAAATVPTAGPHVDPQQQVPQISLQSTQTIDGQEVKVFQRGLQKVYEVQNPEDSGLEVDLSEGLLFFLKLLVPCVVILVPVVMCMIACNTNKWRQVFCCGSWWTPPPGNNYKGATSINTPLAAGQASAAGEDMIIGRAAGHLLQGCNSKPYPEQDAQCCSGVTSTVASDEEGRRGENQLLIAGREVRI